MRTIKFTIPEEKRDMHIVGYFFDELPLTVKSKILDEWTENDPEIDTKEEMLETIRINEYLFTAYGDLIPTLTKHMPYSNPEEFIRLGFNEYKAEYIALDSIEGGTK